MVSHMAKGLKPAQQDGSGREAGGMASYMEVAGWMDQWGVMRASISTGSFIRESGITQRGLSTIRLKGNSEICTPFWARAYPDRM